MAKTQNKELAKFITKQFNSIMKETGLDFEVFASYTKVGKASFRSYYSGTIPISVETLHKICEAYDILLCDFLNENKQLRIKDSVKKQTHTFKIHYIGKKQKAMQEKHVHFTEKPVGTGKKWERDMIKFIVLHTDYFNTPKSIAEMVVDFAVQYNFVLESGRLYELLRKHVDTSLKKEKSIRINNDNTTSKRTIFLYSRV